MPHKKEKSISLLLAWLLLAACAAPAAETPGPTPTPEVTVTPVPTATPTPTPEPTPVPTEEVTNLWGFPIDETHDAFEVSTGGKLGTVLVTVERIEGDYEFMNPAKLSVWDPADLSEPIQVMEVDGFTHYYELLDANFDGYMDFAYTWFLAATNKNDSLWLWDEETGTFVYGEDFAGHGLGLDEEAELVYTYMHGSAASGTTEISRWEDGELLCIRRIETHYPKYEGEVVTQLLTVEDRIDGELTEVYRETFGDPNNGEIYEEAVKWQDLNYRGE